MKKIKKLVCLLMVAILLFSATACSKSTSGEDGVVTVTWMLPISEQPDEALIEAAVNEIAEKEIGVKIDLIGIDGSAFQERMNMNMASGKDFDLCFTGYNNKYANAVYNGGLLELDEMLDKVTPDLKSALPDYAWEVAKMDGKIYAVPNLQFYANPTSVWFFDDLAQKYGFDTKSIKHIEDCEPYFETLVEKEPGVIPYIIDYAPDHWTSPVYEEITPGIVIRKDGSSSKVEIVYDTEEYKDAIHTLHDWYKKGILRSDLVSAQNETAEIKTGKIASHGSGWAPGAEETQKQTYKRPVSIVPIHEPYMNKALCVAAMTGIGRNSKHPEEALKVIELVNTNKDVINLLFLGIKDKHYTLNEEGKYVKIPDSGWNVGGAWMFGNQFNALLAEGQADDVWETSAKMNLESIKSPLLGFTLNTDPIKSEISQLAAVSDEFSKQLQIVEDYANYDKMMAKMKDAGIERVLAEVQKQVDAYWAKNNQ